MEDDDCVEKYVDSARVGEEACAVGGTRKGRGTDGRFRASLDVVLVFGCRASGARMSGGRAGVWDLAFGPGSRICEGAGNES